MENIDKDRKVAAVSLKWYKIAEGLILQYWITISDGRKLHIMRFRMVSKSTTLGLGYLISVYARC